MQTNNQTDELLDVVDDQDKVIGQVTRSKMWSDRIKNVRVINAFLINDNNQLWIPKRTAFKRMFPSCLDFSVGGLVMAGESYHETFARETLEEIGLDIALLPYSFLFSLTPYRDNVSSFMYVYCIRTNITPNYNKNDFESYEWMSIEALKKSIQSGIPVKDDLHIVLLHFESYLHRKEGTP